MSLTYTQPTSRQMNLSDGIVIFVKENENENDEKRQNNEFVNEN